MAKLKTPAIGNVKTAIAYDGTNFVPVLCDSSGHIIALIGNDGTTYRPIKVNASGQVEMVVSGKVPDSDLLDGYDSADFVKKAGDTMTGYLTLAGAPTANLHASTKKYVDDRITSVGTLLKKVWMPDAPSLYPNALDDEFDDNSFNTTKWREFDVPNLLEIAEYNYGLRLALNGATGDKLAGIYQTKPVGNFTMWTKVSLAARNVNYARAGLALYEDVVNNPTTSNIELFGVEFSATAINFLVQQYSDYQTVLNTQVAWGAKSISNHLYLRFRVSDSTWFADWSSDGVGWCNGWQGAALFTPSQIGLCVEQYALATTTYAFFPFFRVTNTGGSYATVESGRLVKLYGD